MRRSRQDFQTISSRVRYTPLTRVLAQHAPTINKIGVYVDETLRGALYQILQGIFTEAPETLELIGFYEEHENAFDPGEYYTEHYRHYIEQRILFYNFLEQNRIPIPAQIQEAYSRHQQIQNQPLTPITFVEDRQLYNISKSEREFIQPWIQNQDIIRFYFDEMSEQAIIDLINNRTFYHFSDETGTVDEYLITLNVLSDQTEIFEMDRSYIEEDMAS